MILTHAHNKLRSVANKVAKTRSQRTVAVVVLDDWNTDEADSRGALSVTISVACPCYDS